MGTGSISLSLADAPPVLFVQTFFFGIAFTYLITRKVPSNFTFINMAEDGENVVEEVPEGNEEVLILLHFFPLDNTDTEIDCYVSS